MGTHQEDIYIKSFKAKAEFFPRFLIIVPFCLKTLWFSPLSFVFYALPYL